MASTVHDGVLRIYFFMVIIFAQTDSNAINFPFSKTAKSLRNNETKIGQIDDFFSIISNALTRY